ncbi:DnaE-like DNA polymerase III [Arthrobacter phage Wollypog]|uniref:DnaE-like DNA polymerase III n=1 Tax=Arthrobacter phage Wollypog TaxID=2790985 RepID=A0A7T3N285_9CAUD|nr:DnaE-like DNA polymerase III [Arthrobacter phage Wollypog]QPX62611.1 DnaE-like DNA polymerase III [Arthrobacter phage Wollypog]
MIWIWLRFGWKFRECHKMSKEKQKLYADRVKYEMSLIQEKEFSSYFLMLSDAIRATKDAGIPVGPARGSAAASLVCYLLRMTEVNPMDYPLMVFERFIDSTRMDLPDVDVDFDDDLRDFVRMHFVGKYGADRVGNIGTYTRYRGKNAIDDVARVFEIPKWEVDKAKEFLVERSGGDARFDASISDTVEMFPQVKEVFDKYPDLYKTMDLEGNLKGFGVHAAGIVVGADKLHNYVATYSKAAGKDQRVLQVLSVDKYDGEHLGMLKLDALSLGTLGMIRLALEDIGMTLADLYDIPMDEPETLAAFEKADVTGIFQFEGRAMRMVCQELKPKTFMDLAAVNALARPGPLHSGSTGDYLAIREGRMDRGEIHPLISRITAETEGQIIYQEQILQICREFGDFPWTHASAVRKIISNKKGESAFNAMWADFRDGAARRNGVDEQTAAEVWKRMITAGTYAFNVAHCISYSMLGFWAMWLKVHHPIAFYTAQLKKTEDPLKQIPILRDMADRRFGRDYKVLPPDVNKSGITWSSEPDGVRAGFSQIPGVGEKTATLIIETRDKMGGFDSWEDLNMVKGIGPKSMEKIRAFCEQKDPFKVYFIRDNVAAIKEAVAAGQLGDCPMPNTVAEDIPYDPVKTRHVVCGTVKARNLQDLFENHRSRTGEEMDPNSIDRPDLKDYMTLHAEDESGPLTIRIDRYKYPKIKQQIWDLRLNHDFIVVEAVKTPMYGKAVKVVNIWVINPDE